MDSKDLTTENSEKVCGESAGDAICAHTNARKVIRCSTGCCTYYRCPDCGHGWREHDSAETAKAAPVLRVDAGDLESVTEAAVLSHKQYIRATSELLKAQTDLELLRETLTNVMSVKDEVSASTIQAVVAAEREACAEMLDPAYPHLAEAIRARGKA